MKECILFKCGEMVLKGLNRASFEKKFRARIESRMSEFGRFRLNFSQSTATLTPLDENADMSGAWKASQKIFGAVSVCLAGVCEKDMNEVLPFAAEYLRDKLSMARTFKCEARRSDKAFPLNSPEIMSAAGEYILDKYPHLKVDVHHPELVVRIEVRDKAVFVHDGGTEGAGGLPSGVGGRAVCLLSGGIDSPVALWMMAKRGMEIIPVHFWSYPYTSQRALEKVEQLASIVGEYAGSMRLYVVPFTKVQEAIRDHSPEDMRTVTLRRMMMRASARVAANTRARALITGENLGQVASQTLDAICCTDAVCDIPVFRPLIGADKQDIISIARRIETFETSTLPYEDCCTIFTPKHPRTKPTLRHAAEAESELDIEALLDEAMSGVEIS